MNNNSVAKLLRLSPLLLLLSMLGGQHAFAARCHASCYHQTAVIALKSASSSSWSYDDGFIDQSSRTLYLADRTARAVDIIDLRLNTVVDLLTGGLTGPDQEHKVDGPNHVLKVAKDVLAVSNGNSSVVFFDLQTRKVIATTPTHGRFRTDALAFDPQDHLLLAVNGDEPLPFISFIDTQETKTFPLVKTLSFPDATGGLDDVAFDARSGVFLLSVVGAKTAPYGVVVAISPASKNVVHAYPLHYVCGPNGLAFADQTLAVNCSTGNPVLIQFDTGKTTIVPDTDSGDFAASTHGLFFFAQANTLGSTLSTLAIVNAQDHTLQQIPIAAGSHAVFADTQTGKVYVPQGGIGMVVYRDQ